MSSYLCTLCFDQLESYKMGDISPLYQCLIIFFTIRLCYGLRNQCLIRKVVSIRKSLSKSMCFTGIEDPNANLSIAHQPTHSLTHSLTHSIIYILMYVCMYVCTLVCMYVCMFA